MARPSHAIKLVSLMASMLSLTLCLAIAACDYTAMSSDQSSLPVGVSDYQQEKQNIIDDFYENPEHAKSTYPKQWKDKRSERAKATAVGPTVVWLTIAGGLLETDAANYDEYYSYITQHLNDSNWEVAATAVNALRGARGHESIDQIVRMIGDPREMVAADAVLTIDYRLKTSLYESSLKSDYEYAMAKMKDVCQKSGSVRRLEQICQENKAGP